MATISVWSPGASGLVCDDDAVGGPMLQARSVCRRPSPVATLRLPRIASAPQSCRRFVDPRGRRLLVCSAAPQGRARSARGIAPGTRHRHRAREPRRGDTWIGSASAASASLHGLIAPFQGSDLIGIPGNPGRRPGLTCFRPSAGRRTSTSPLDEAPLPIAKSDAPPRATAHRVCRSRIAAREIRASIG